MRIKWVLSAASVVDDGGGLTSPLASYRYRAAIPIAVLRARGHACSWHGVRQTERIDADHPALQDADVAVFGKNHTEAAEIMRLMEHARAA